MPKNNNLKKPLTIQAIDKQLEKLELKKTALNKQRDLLLSQQTMVECGVNTYHGKGSCGSKFSIGDLIYIQTYVYDPNTGSPNGGEWVEAEGQWECPRCQRRNRFIHEMKQLRRLFKATTKEKPNY